MPTRLGSSPTTGLCICSLITNISALHVTANFVWKRLFKVPNSFLQLQIYTGKNHCPNFSLHQLYLEGDVRLYQIEKDCSSKPCVCLSNMMYMSYYVIVLLGDRERLNYSSILHVRYLSISCNQYVNHKS